MKETREIYALCDPQTGDVKYIGSAFEAAKRYRGHLSTNASKKVKEWVASLKERGLRPELKVLETVPTRQATAREHHWVMQFTTANTELLNGRYVVENRGGASVVVTVTMNEAEFRMYNQLVEAMDSDPSVDVRINGNLDRTEVIRRAIREALCSRMNLWTIGASQAWRP